MTTKTQARAARLAALLNDDGTVTPAEHLPEGLLIEGPEVETLYLEALTAETIGEGLQAVRTEAGLSTAEVLTRRRVTKGRLSQLEHRDVNPQLSSITQQADALDYDVTIVFTPRDKARRAVRVAVKPVASNQ
jgi:Helix-turn-helix domain